jgi:hypothetical protein
MTERDNTSISAVGVLFIAEQREISLQVYHNKFAKVPLSHALLLANRGIAQFQLGDALPNSAPDWDQV